MTGYLLDTHYWIWLQVGNTDELGEEAREGLTSFQRESSLHLSAISVLEAARLVADGHLELGTSIERFVEEATGTGKLELVQLTTRILIESTRLPGELHRDPADRILIATAREHGLTLVTRDKLLLNYAKQGHLNARKL